MRDKFKERDNRTEERAANAIKSIKEENGVVTISINGTLIYKSVKDSAPIFSSALKEITGKEYKVILKAEESKEVEEISENMMKLRNIFGGNVIFHKDERPKERKENEYKPVRANEADGDDRVQDEECEG